MDIPQGNVISAIVLALSLAGTIAAAIFASRKRKQEKTDATENEREESAEAGDFDLEHLDRERLRRLRE